jgi:hypothetical protein
MCETRETQKGHPMLPCCFASHSDSVEGCLVRLFSLDICLVHWFSLVFAGFRWFSLGFADFHWFSLHMCST